MPQADSQHAPDPPSDSAGWRNSGWSRIAVVVLVAAAATLGFTLVSNFDFFWHLAAGRWMLTHKAVLDFDPFSIDPQDQWVNVHWLFQLLITAAYRLGGLGLLTVVKSAAAAATMLILGLYLRKRISPAWLIFSGLAMLAIVAARLRLRPEIFSLSLMLLTIVLLEAVRIGGATRRLWWLVPIMLVWVNMHGLYIIGLGIIWSSLAGGWLDRRAKRTAGTGRLLTTDALAPILAATVCVLVSPWPVQSAMHPLLLWQRISGQAFTYTYGVTELRPSWQAPGEHLEAIVLVVLTAAVMIANRKRVPVAHVVWLAAMVALGAMARRNVGLMGPVVGFLLAWHGGALLNRLAKGRPKLARASPYFAGLMAAVAVAVIFANVTSGTWRWLGWQRRFGPGLQSEKYPIAAAKFLRELPGKGDLLCENFGDASTFIYHSYPMRKLYMDGRLEAHSPERFIEQFRIANALRTTDSADRAELPEAVRFIFVRCDSSEALRALAQSGRFKLIYLDEVGACFARTDWHMDTAVMPEPNFSDFDVPLDDLINGPATGGAIRPWYAQNPPPVNYQVGAMMLSLGQQDPGMRARPSGIQQRCILLAVRYLVAADLRGVISNVTARGTLAQACQQRSLQHDVTLSKDLPVDINSVRALYLYRQMDLTDLSDRDVLMFAQQQIVAMQQARQIDAAAAAAGELLNNLPPQQQVSPPREYLRLRDTLAKALDRSQVRASKIERTAPLADQIRQLTSPSIGLIMQATERIAIAARDDPKARMLLGELMLRQGLVTQAREAYGAPGETDGIADQLALRLALCDWAEGKLADADHSLGSLAKRPGQAAARYYRAVLLEQLGRYAEAKDVINKAASEDAALQYAIKRVRRRLADRQSPGGS